ncbi:hypothetical protein CVU37_13725 [candidate division BRC1 bacterium HGW-BRC1-1]|jgi:hypothetical protein|nr:MAG: hypothetical protein CVU37_13725 [candidate division BRC1 bacterium HGW-BRC1-1]
MNIPHYWARAEMEGRNRQGDVLPFIAWGSSDQSDSDARRQAQHNVEQLVARYQSGDKFPDRGQYYGGDRPLREEILQEFSPGDNPDSAIVTRNSYGCSVLNAARLMFIDIDLPSLATDATLGDAMGMLARFGRKLFGGGSKESDRPTTENSEQGMSHRELAVIEKARQWTNLHANWGFRVYRTAGGLRLLAIHDFFDPQGSAAAEVMNTLGADPMYMRLCRSQNCFRARLTPKPWRVGVQSAFFRHPWKGTSNEGAARDWLRQYEYACQQAQTCQHLANIGRDKVAQELETLVTFHDEATGAVNTTLRKLA